MASSGPNKPVQVETAGRAGRGDVADPPLRADAQRNRDRLLVAAMAAFAGGTDVSLEAVARDAGVGIGTLYRHFPTREALVEAVFRTELGQLCDVADELLDEFEPARALRTWMDRYADFVTAKRGMAQALRDVVASGALQSARTRERLAAAVASMLDAGSAAGELRNDVAPADVVAGLVGVMWAAADPEQRRRMLDLQLDALRAPGGP